MSTRIAAALVMILLLAGCVAQPRRAAQEPAPEPTQTTGMAGSSDALTFVARDIEYAQAPSEAPAGQVSVELVNEGAIEHDVVIEELGDQAVAAAGGGETATGQVGLQPGAYTYYCSVPGHRAAGMEGTLTVEG
jgi:plastocyanin